MITNRFATQSKRLVDKAGKAITYRRVVDGEYDPEEGEVVNTETSTQCKAFKVQANNSEIMSPSMIGKDISVFLIAGLDLNFVPKANDFIDYSNLTETFTVQVLQVKEHWAGDKVSLWRLVCASQ